MQNSAGFAALVKARDDVSEGDEGVSQPSLLDMEGRIALVKSDKRRQRRLAIAQLVTSVVESRRVDQAKLAAAAESAGSSAVLPTAPSTAVKASLDEEKGGQLVAAEAREQGAVSRSTYIEVYDAAS